MDMTIVKFKIDESFLGKDAFFVVSNNDVAMKKIDYGTHCNCNVKQIEYNKMRSHEQLSLYFVGCRFIASIRDDVNFDTQKKVDWQTRIACRYVDSYFYYENKKTGEQTLNLIPRSISYSELDHLDACNFFNDAFHYQCEIYNTTMLVDISKDEYVELLKNYIKNNYSEAQGL